MTETQESYSAVTPDGELIEATAVVPFVGGGAILNVDDALAEWRDYQRLTHDLLDDQDYQKIGNRQFKKKSAWRKYGRAFRISCVTTSEEIIRSDDGFPIYARIRVLATDRQGNRQEADHEAHVKERCCPAAKGETCRKKTWQGHDCCTAGCDGRVHWSHPGDLPATATTRAKNRAISDIIGAGEVSAEEMEEQTKEPTRARTPGRAGTQGAQGSAPRPLEPANPASKPQKDSIASMLHQLPEPDAEEFCQEYDITIETRQDGRHYGKGVEAAGLTGGTHGTASQLIDALLPLVKGATKGKPAPRGGVERADPREAEVTEEELQMEKWRLTGDGRTTPKATSSSAIGAASDLPHPNDIKTIGDLFTVCWQEHHLQRGEVLDRLGVEKVAKIASPAAAYKIIQHSLGKDSPAAPEQPALIEEA